MSKVAIFTIYDRAASIYGTPFYSHNKQTALRSVAAEINRDDPSSTLASSPADFDLYELGEYDQDTGRFETFDTPQFVFSCTQLLAKPAVNPPAPLSAS